MGIEAKKESAMKLKYNHIYDDIINLQHQIGVCQALRETLTFVYILIYDNHPLSYFERLKIFEGFQEKF